MLFPSALATVIALVTLVAFSQAKAATVSITEWMYSGTGGEYIEFTNTSGADINFAG